MGLIIRSLTFLYWPTPPISLMDGFSGLQRRDLEKSFSGDFSPRMVYITYALQQEETVWTDRLRLYPRYAANPISRC